MIESLLDQMTLEEQVSLLAGNDFWNTVAIERLGVPKIKVTDGPNGARGGGSLVGGVKSACFPCAVSVGSTWNPELVQEMGVALAEEAKTKSARVLLAPTVNIHRSGLNGRNFECYSEDPALTAEIAVAYINGVQSQGVAATIKHYVGNESEIERNTISTNVDERTLREIYLPPFEQAVKRAHVWAIMTSYNKVNGTFSSESPFLLSQVLRGEWGFDGVAMSDWFGSHSTAETVNAGLDLEMPGPTRDRGAKLVQAVKEGKVAPEAVRASARRVLQLLERVGAFADPTMADEIAVDDPKHRALIRKIGTEGAVLLKNDGILPLAKDQVGQIALLGPNAVEARVMGGGSAQINAHYRVTPVDGISAALSGVNAIIPRRAVSSNRLTPLVMDPVKVEFFNSRDWSGPVVYAYELSFSEAFWGEVPDKAVNKEAFSARMTTTFIAEETAEHVFGLVTAGLGKLYVDGQLIVNSWDGWQQGDNFFTDGNVEQRGSIELKAGQSYKVTVEFATHEPKVGVVGFGVRAVRFGIEKPLTEADFAEAVEQARQADTAVVLVGRHGEWDTEGNDLPNFRLPGRQDELIARVAAVNPKTIVMLQTGGPVLMPWLKDVAAVVQVYYPGQEAGNSIADILFGEAEPAGRLTQTYPKSEADVSAFTADPLTYPGKDGATEYREGVFVGYRHFDRTKAEPLFPFGFGLSYTTFAWGAPQLSSDALNPAAAPLTVSVTVTNTGTREGSDVVQLYLRSPAAPVARPDKELRAFSKVKLAPGQTTTVHLPINPRDLAYFDVETQAWVALGGRYEAVIAASATDIRGTVAFTLANDWHESV